MMNTTEANGRSYRELQPWADCVSQTLVNLDFLAKEAHFSGSYHYVSTRNDVAARLFGTPHRTSRSMHKLREVENDFILLIYLKSGQAIVSHRRQDGLVPEGSFIAVDASKPHELAMSEHFDHLVLRMPKARFLSLHPAISSMFDQPVRGQSQEIRAAARILDMTASLGGAMPSTISTMSETVVRLLGDWIAKDAEHGDRRLPRHDLLARRVMKCLEDNYTDPDYSAPRLAAAVGISRRYVDSIFAEMNSTVGKTLLEKRLERCHRLLTNPRSRGRSVTDVAFESGFNDLSYFSKRFKERFGVAPRQARKSASEA